MLIVSKERYVPISVNMMTLQGEDGTYFYVHRSLYDQCVVLRDIYKKTMNTLYLSLIGKEEHPELCDVFEGSVPEPLDVLAPYLTLIKDIEGIGSVEDMCGAISIMSMQVNFRKMLKFPAELRSSVKFSLCIKDEYAIEWNRFFQETPTIEEVYTPNVTHDELKEDDSTGIVREGNTIYIDDDVDLDIGDYSAFMTEDDFDGGNEDGEEDEDDEEEEAEETMGKKSGFSLLRGLAK